MVKCSECGLLGLHRRGTLQEPSPVPTAMRGGGRLTGFDAGSWDYVCTLEKADLPSQTQGGNLHAWKALDDRERPECEDTFIKWNAAFTPKEHAAMLDRRRLRDWQAAQERLNREHHERLTAASDKIQASMAGATRSAARYQLAGVIVGVLGVLAAVGIALWLGGGTEAHVTISLPTPDSAAQP